MRPSRRKGLARRHRIRQIAFDFLGSLAIFLIVFGIAVVDSDAAFPAEVPGAASHGGSALLLQTTRDKPYDSAVDAGTDIAVQVNGGLAEAIVTQRFFNPSSRPVAGAFSYALPESAVLQGLKIRNGAQRIETRLETRENAEAIRRAAERLAGPIMLPGPERNPGLWLPIARIEPGSYATVELRYNWMILADSGRFELELPVPAATAGNSRSAANAASKTTLAIELDAGFPIAQIESLSHEIDVERRTDGTARIRLLDPAAAGSQKRFAVRWTLQAGMLPSTALYRETFAGEDYVLALLTPPSPEARITIRPREIVYLVDTSQAMAGLRLDRVKAGLLSSLAGLEPGDRLNIITYGSTVQALFSKPVELSRDTRIAAEDFINSMKGEGTAAIVPALKAALADTTLSKSSLVRQVVVVTAGLSTDEPELITTIANGRGRSRLLLIGFEDAGDAEFMRRAAEVGRGSYTALRRGDGISQRISLLLNKLSRPVVTDLKAEWAGGVRVESFPAPLPDLNAGEPVAVIAKASTLKGKLTISGDLGGSSWTSELSLARAKPATGIAALWTQRKIATLEARRFGGQDANEIDAEIRKVAFSAGIASRSTDWVTVDVASQFPDDINGAYPGERNAVALGWDFERVLPELPAGQPQTLAEIGPGKPAAHFDLPVTVVSLQGSETIALDVRRANELAPGSRRMPLDQAMMTLAEAFRRLLPNATPLPAFAAQPTGLQSDTTSAEASTGGHQFERLFNILVLALVFAGMCTLVIGLWRQLKNHYIGDNSPSSSRS